MGMAETKAFLVLLAVTTVRRSATLTRDHNAHTCVTS